MLSLDKNLLFKISKKFIISRTLIMSIFVVISLYFNVSLYSIFYKYDVIHYLEIAQNGYSADYLYAFFPLFPLIMSIFNVFKIPILGTIVLNIFISFLSTILLYKISTNVLKNNEEVTDKILSVWLFSPIALFTVLPYTESIFIFLSLLAFYLYKTKSKPILFGLLLGLTVCTRNVGCIYFFVYFIFLFIEFLKEKKKDIKSNLFLYGLKSYIPATIISCLYPFYLYIKAGNWKLFVDVQYTYWEKIKGNFLTMINQNIKLLQGHSLPDSSSYIAIVLDTIIILSVIVILIYFIINSFLYKKCESLDLITIIIATFIICSSTMKLGNDTSASCSLYRYLLGMYPSYLLINEKTKTNLIKYIFVFYLIIATFAFSIGMFLC